MLHTYTFKPMSLPHINFPYLRVSEIQPGQNFIGQGDYSNVKGKIKVRPWCCTPTPLNNVPTNYQLPTPYGFRNIAQKILKVKVTRPRSNESHIIMVHTFTPYQCPYQVSTSYVVMVSEIQNSQAFSHHPSIRTPLVNTIPTQSSKAVGF